MAQSTKEVGKNLLLFIKLGITIQVGLHRSEVAGLEKKLDEVTENFNVDQSKREISDTERLRVQKNVEDLRQAKEECYNVAMECSNRLKMLLLVLVHSRRSKISFVVILRVRSNGLRAKSKHLTKF
jgi:hypothetical protein